MTDTRSAWAEVGDQLSSLCLKIKLHAEEELSDADVRAKAGFERLRTAMEELVDGLGDAFEDDAVRTNAKDLGRAFTDAVEVTVREARDRIRSTSSS